MTTMSRENDKVTEVLVTIKRVKCV